MPKFSPADIAGLLDIVRTLGHLARPPGRPKKQSLQDLVAEASKFPELREALAKAEGA